MLNWQASADGLDPLPPEQSRDADGCPTGMIRARGRYLVDEQGRDTNDRVFSLQNQACSKWRTRSHGIDGVCENFDAEKWKTLRADLPTVAIDVCVDRYEFPNRYGEFPLVVTMFSESAKYCKAAGKRLCTESEWTFACEGEAGLPYPYGYERDSAKCNIDVMAPGAGGDTFKPRTTARTARGIDVAFRGKRSGASPECVSPLGAEDMTGNVDEWTRSVRGYGYKMILKGGHWGPARQRCRPQTRGHGPRYVRYDQGFRCCADAPK